MLALKRMSSSFFTSVLIEVEKGTDSCSKPSSCGTVRGGSVVGDLGQGTAIPIALGLWENPLTSLNSDGPEFPHLKNGANYMCPSCFTGRSAQLRWSEDGISPKFVPG